RGCDMKKVVLGALAVLAVIPASAGSFDLGLRLPSLNVTELTKGLRLAASEMPAPTGGPVRTFAGSSRWTKSRFEHFSPLEQLGVRKSAEQNAVIKYQDAGALNCVAVASRITICNGFTCE